jgi:hypothetical protein
LLCKYLMEIWSSELLFAEKSELLFENLISFMLCSGGLNGKRNKFWVFVMVRGAFGVIYRLKLSVNYRIFRYLTEHSEWVLPFLIWCLNYCSEYQPNSRPNSEHNIQFIVMFPQKTHIHTNFECIHFETFPFLQNKNKSN